MSVYPVITIDGPSGSGKGTISMLLARRLGWRLLDSGALYRVLALAAINHGISPENSAGLEVLARNLEVEFVTPVQLDHLHRVLLEEQDVSEAIRQENIGNIASQIAAFPEVRSALIDRQRAFRGSPGLVTDGRDMGTVIFPDANLKIFLMASAEERAQRRFLQLKKRGIDANLALVLEEIQVRDARDKSRSIAPLMPAADAVLLDTTGISVEEVLQRVLKLVEERIPKVLVET